MPEDYTSPEAIVRVCEEVERIVWPIDRAFADNHPNREYWIRPAEDIEITEQELASGQIAPPLPQGVHFYTAVRLIAAGVRIRILFYGGDVGDSWRTLSEEFCRLMYVGLEVREWPDALPDEGPAERVWQ